MTHECSQTAIYTWHFPVEIFPSRLGTISSPISAYPVCQWILPPFKDNSALSHNQKQYNFEHSSKRITIEHAFGLLKTRFQRLTQPTRNITDLPSVIVACCCLHNLCMRFNCATPTQVYCEEAVAPTPQKYVLRTEWTKESRQCSFSDFGFLLKIGLQCVRNRNESAGRLLQDLRAASPRPGVASLRAPRISVGARRSAAMQTCDADPLSTRRFLAGGRGGGMASSLLLSLSEDESLSALAASSCAALLGPASDEQLDTGLSCLLLARSNCSWHCL